MVSALRSRKGQQLTVRRCPQRRPRLHKATPLPEKTCGGRCPGQTPRRARHSSQCGSLSRGACAFFLCRCAHAPRFAALLTQLKTKRTRERRLLDAVPFNSYFVGALHQQAGQGTSQGDLRSGCQTLSWLRNLCDKDDLRVCLWRCALLLLLSLLLLWCLSRSYLSRSRWAASPSFPPSALEHAVLACGDYCNLLDS